MASPLYDKLMEDLKTAMKAHDKAALNAIRGTIAKVKDLTVNAVKAVVADLGATSKKDMGRVMKEVMARVKGQADGTKQWAVRSDFSAGTHDW